MTILLISFSSLAGAWALSSTDTLPAGISNPQVRMGSIENLGHRYTDSGTLMYLGDTKSVVFDAESLMQLNAAARNLVEALNRFGTQELGNNLNLGVLRVKTLPQISYVAPVFAHGVSDRWSLGLGLPVITYKNQVSLSQEGSNLEFYRSQLTGLSPELDEALQTDLVYETVATLSERGYKPIENKNETFLADVQLSSLYRFMEDERQSALYQVTLTLPTGPKYNPDDLVAINSFGRTSIENKIIYQQKIDSFWKVAPHFAHSYFFPEHITMRIPENENDYLPNSSRKSDVRRDIGSTFTLGADLGLEVSKVWSFGFGYELGHKLKDSIRGSDYPDEQYDLLERNTDSNFQRVVAQVTYSTIDLFFKKKALIPMMVSLTLGDTIAGRNIERRSNQELNFMLFF